MIPLKIYIVEDDAIIALSIETALKKQGYTVCGNADTMEEAKEEIRKRNPDLVLVDIQLDGTKDGIDLAENLDKEGVPYLYLTSQTDPHTICYSLYIEDNR